MRLLDAQGAAYTVILTIYSRGGRVYSLFLNLSCSIGDKDPFLCPWLHPDGESQPIEGGLGSPRWLVLSAVNYAETLLTNQ